MAKSLFLLFCCVFVSRALWAQAPRPDTALPQKLNIKKASPGWADHPKYFTKKLPGTGTDSTQSLMYMKPGKRDSLQLRLPAQKNKKVELQIKARQREQMLRRQ